MNVPFLDLKAQYESIRSEIAEEIQQVLDNTAFAGGPFVKRFEEEFAFFCETKHAIGVGSGTEALWLALLAMGIGSGDEVITVPNTFIATGEAISYCPATPVFIDINEDTYTMDPAQIESAITSKTKAIMPVHLYGQPADMDPIMEIARKYGLLVIEDACQAHGALYKGKPAGSISNAGCFSFYPGKNLGAYGEAGAVITNDNDLAGKIRMLRDHGQSKKYEHRMIGWNARMDGIQGAVLSVKLRHLKQWNDARIDHAQKYSELLSGVSGLVLPRRAEYAKHVYHIYAVRTARRDQIIAELKENGVASGIHYPAPLHLEEAYRKLRHIRGDFPVAEKCCDQVLSLPMYPEMTDEQISYVADNLKKATKLKAAMHA
jgi:dTDP-4-amino-4,6-dideoxygalactose transaminase